MFIVQYKSGYSKCVNVPETYRYVSFALSGY